MAETLYASFADPSLAEKAAGALLDYGVKQEDISLVARQDTDGSGRRDYVTHSASVAEREGAGTATLDREADSTYDTARTDVDDAGNRAAATGDRLAANVGGALGADRAAANYEQAAADREANANVASRGYNSAVTDADTGPASTEVTPGGARNTDDTDLAAKHGISTTTPGDAASGAAKGAGVGLGVGILAAIASLVVPGFGLVAGGGALATALAGAAGATAAGALSGGVLGYLKEQGVPDEVATHYDQALQQGGALLSINLPSGDVDRATAESVLAKYQASNVQSFGARA